jgi:hypothetical protein
VQFFLYLQALDFLTTVVGFEYGLAEASPFVRWLLHFGPVAGVFLSKLLAAALAAVCVFLHKPFLVRWINYWYGALVLWNLGVMWAGPPSS